jgi:hypothetical protein
MASWTLMLYWAADADIESDLLRELARIRSTTLPDNVRIVAMVDRADSRDASLLDLRPRRGSCETSLPLEPNTGDPAVLGELFDLALASPSDRYALVMKGHGYGYTGLCFDDHLGQNPTNKDDRLSVTDLADAVSTFARRRGSKLDLLFMDACYMAHVEVLALLGASTDVVVASADTLLTETVCYESFIREAGVTADPRTLARTIVDASLRWSEDPRWHLRRAACEPGRLHGIVASFDGAKLGEVARPLEDFADSLGRKLLNDDEKLRVASARANAEGYEDSSGHRTSQIDITTYRHRDVGDLCEQVMARWPDSDPAHATAAALLERLRAATLAPASAGSDCPRGTGLTIHFPFGPGDKKDPYPDVVGATSKWLAFVDLYVKEVGNVPIEVSKPTVTPNTLEPGLPAIHVKAKFNARASAAASAVYFSTARPSPAPMFLGSLPVAPIVASEADYPWDGTWPLLVAGDSSVPCPVRSARVLGDKRLGYVVDAPVLLHPAAKGPATLPTRRVTLRLVYQQRGTTWQGQFLYACVRSPLGDRRVWLSPGDRVEAVYQLGFNGASESVDAPGGPEATLTIGDDGRLDARVGLLADGDWWVLLYPRDMLGQAYLPGAESGELPRVSLKMLPH